MLNVYFYNRRIKEAPSSDAQRYKIVSKKNLRGGGSPRKQGMPQFKLGHIFFIP